MADLLISESLTQNNEASKMTRDPFQGAQNQFASKQGSVLSSSPMGGNSALDLQQSPDVPNLGAVFGKIGISDQGLSMSPVGRVQLVGRLRDKYGEGFMQNEDAIQALKAFDDNLKMQGSDSQNNFQQSLANANRTLGALLGGNNGA